MKDRGVRRSIKRRGKKKGEGWGKRGRVREKGEREEGVRGFRKS